jgi:UDP-glucose 4-epimerase
MRNIFITGGAGFIGSNLVKALVNKHYKIIVYDNLSTGTIENLSSVINKIDFYNGDLLDTDFLINCIKGCDFVFHLAANADVRFGIDHPSKDLHQNTIATFNVLEAMRENNIQKIAFSSTGSVYGEALVIPTPENAPFPIQTSLYSASKLAGEGLIEAYCEGFGFQAWIFRFVSVLGPKYSHGHVIDFYNQLIEHPDVLKVLGNGTQTKSYMHVNDCINGMLHAVNWSNKKINLFNLGTDETITVNDSIKILCNYLNLSPKIEYTGGNQGWIGDNPIIYLNTNKIKSLEWKPKYSIKQGIVDTIEYLIKNS